MYRVRGVSWWDEELPTKEEMQNGLDNLQKYGNKVDYIITHCTATGIQEQFGDGYKPDHLTDYLEYIRTHVQYEKWYFGHYPEDADVTKKDILLYDDIIRLT